MSAWMLAFLLMLLGPQAHADHLTLLFGGSIENAPNPKLLKLGWEKVFDPASLHVACGAMFEGETNVECSAVLSMRVQTPGGVFARIGAGPAYVMHTDDRVSSNLNANIQAALGLIQNGYEVGACWDHLSNGGLVPPNLGRDFLGLCIGWQL